jgi:glycosyltransferase involved in cell wall biosynthesis
LTVITEICMPDSRELIDCATAPGAFVIPMYGDQPNSMRYLDDALEGIEAQTDSNWRVILVDDASPNSRFIDHAASIANRSPGRIHLITLPTNRGHGHARNLAIRRGAELGSPFVLYNDVDDISHPRRLETVRSILATQPAVTLVYSTFSAIDEKGATIPDHDLVATNQDSLRVQRSRPIEGADAWLRIGLDPGSACLPSSTAFRTSAGLCCPSPLETPSEDTYQWMHISAAGGTFKFVPTVPTRYRVTSSVSGISHHRQRMGLAKFYKSTVDVRTAGFRNAMTVAAARGWRSQISDEHLLTLFNLRLADNMAKVGEPDIASEILQDLALSSYPAARTAMHFSD